MDHGTYLEVDGRPAVRFERTYPHPIERVWAALTDTDELGHWFPASVQIDLRTGGSISFGGDPHADVESGTVLVIEPPYRLSYTWGTDELHFTLAPTEHGCTLELIDVLEEMEAAARQAAGWAVCLGELDKHMVGEQADGPHSDSALPWRPLYDEAVAAGIPHGAPIPDTEGVRG